MQCLMEESDPKKQNGLGTLKHHFSALTLNEPALCKLYVSLFRTEQI